MSGWRITARKVIQDAIDSRRGEPFEVVLAAIDAAYPFGSRDHWPYTVWLQERRAAIARLQGRTLNWNAKQRPLAPPFVPDPAIEEWVMAHA